MCESTDARKEIMFKIDEFSTIFHAINHPSTISPPPSETADHHTRCNLVRSTVLHSYCSARRGRNCHLIVQNAAVIDPEMLLNVFAQILYNSFATSCVPSVTAAVGTARTDERLYELRAPRRVCRTR